VNAFSLAGLFFFYRLAVEKDGEKAAMHSLVLFLAFPSAFVLLVPYSEALFLCLAGGFFLALKKERYWLASLLCGLMTLARPVGIFLVLPLVWELWKGKKISRWACLLVPAAALAFYFAIMKHYTGDWFAFFKAQSHYIAHADIARLVKPGQFLKTLFCLHPVWHDYLNSVVDRLWFLVFAGSLFFLWRYDRTYFWYSLPMGLVPAATNCFASYTRYFFTIFPIFMMAGNRFSKASSKWVYALLVSALFLLQILFLLRHINNDWAV
jgi:Gpi18-like mannosyltransferase